MIGDWINTKLFCKQCRAELEVRYGSKTIQVKTNNRWVEIASHASIVLCDRCGSCVDISYVKGLLQMRQVSEKRS